MLSAVLRCLVNRGCEGGSGSRNIVSADNRRDDCNPGSPGLNDLSDVAQGDAADGYDWKIKPGAQLPNRAAADRFVPGGLRGRREDRADAQIVGPLLCGLDGLLQGVGRNPEDLARPQERSGGPGRQVVLSKVDPIGTGRERQIQPVIDDETRPTFPTKLGDLARLRQKMAGSGRLVSELDHRCATLNGSDRNFNVAQPASQLTIGDDAQAACLRGNQGAISVRGLRMVNQLGLHDLYEVYESVLRLALHRYRNACLRGGGRRCR